MMIFASTKNHPGLCIPREKWFCLLSPGSLDTFPLPVILEALGLPGRLFRVCLCFISCNSGSAPESATFSTLLFAPVSRLLKYIYKYIPAVWAAGLRVPEGMKISTSVHAENLLLTPMLHFKKIHSREPDKVFPAYQPDSNILEGYFTFTHPVFPGLLKIDFPLVKNKSFSWQKIWKDQKSIMRKIIPYILIPWSITLNLFGKWLQSLFFFFFCYFSFFSFFLPSFLPFFQVKYSWFVMC